MLSRSISFIAALAIAVPLFAQQGGEASGDIPNFPFRTGVIPTPEAELKSIPTLSIAPGKRSLRPTYYILEPEYLPPVMSQGPQGSCTGWSTAYYNYTYGVTRRLKLDKEKRADSRWKFSPSYVYNQINNGVDKGSVIGQAVKLMNAQGCATLAESPYKVDDFTTKPNSDAKERAAKYKAPSFACFSQGAKPDLEAVKRYLYEVRNPVSFGLFLRENFPTGSKEADYVYDGEGKRIGGHAMTIIGYDDQKAAFLIVNSWGERWGNKGFLYISYDSMKNDGFEFWAITPGGWDGRNGPKPTLTTPADPKTPVTLVVNPPAGS